MARSTALRWATALITVALAISAYLLSKQPSHSGPIPPIDESSTAYIPVDVGTIVSFGTPKVTNTGNHPATVLKLELHPGNDGPGDPGVTVTDVYVLDMTGIRETAGLAIGFPPPSQSQHRFVPAVGSSLQPNTMYQVMFVVKAEKPGRWTFPTFDLLYEVQGKKYTTTNHAGLRVCVPASQNCQ